MPDITTCSNRNGSQIYGPSLTLVLVIRTLSSLLERFESNLTCGFYFEHSLSSHTLGMCPVCNAIYSSASYNTNTFQIILFYLLPFLRLSSSFRFSLHLFTECSEFVSTPIFYRTKFKTIPHTIIRIRWGRGHGKCFIC